MLYRDYIDKQIKVIGDNHVANFHRIYVGKTVEDTIPVCLFGIMDDDVVITSNDNEPHRVSDFLKQQSVTVCCCGEENVSDMTVLVDIKGKYYELIDIVFNKKTRSLVFIHGEEECQRNKSGYLEENQKLKKKQIN